MLSLHQSVTRIKEINKLIIMTSGPIVICKSRREWSPTWPAAWRAMALTALVLAIVLWTAASSLLLLIFGDSSIWRRLHSWNSRRAWRRSWPHSCRTSNWFRTQRRRHRARTLVTILQALVDSSPVMINATLLDLLERIFTMIKLLQLKHHLQLHLQLKHSPTPILCIFLNQQPPATCLNFFPPVIPKPMTTVIPASASVVWFDWFDWLLILSIFLYSLLI